MKLLDNTAIQEWFTFIYKMNLELGGPTEALPKLKVKPGAGTDFIYVAQIAGHAAEGVSPEAAMDNLQSDLRESILVLIRNHEVDADKLRTIIGLRQIPA